MRKNLFLTLALIIASIATVNAQWTRTLGAMDGLPGALNETNNRIVKTGLISPDEAIEGLRISVIHIMNEASNTINKGTPMAVFSEIKVLDADGNEVPFTATSNSIQSGEGSLANLNDGNFDTYYHSFWGGGTNDRAEGEYVYVELAFEEPVSAFRLMMASSNKLDLHYNSMPPTVVTLSPAGVKVSDIEAPATDLGQYELKGQLTTLDAITAAKYVTIQTTNIKSWKDDKDTKAEYNDYIGWGPRYLQAATGYTHPDSAATAKNAVQLIPTGNGTYYLYFCNAGGYMQKNVIDHTNSQNWLWMGSKENAAELTLHQADGGLVEMSFETNLNDEDETPITGWVIADPRWWDGQNYALKVVTPSAKADVQSENPQYPEGSYRLPGSFGFKFYECDYTSPSYLTALALNASIFDASIHVNQFGGAQTMIEELLGATYYQNLKDALAQAQEYIDNGATTAEAQAAAAAINENLVYYLFTVAYQKVVDANAVRDSIGDVTYDENEEPVYGPNSQFCDATNPEPGKYTLDSWNNSVENVTGAWQTSSIIYKVTAAMEAGTSVAAACAPEEFIAEFDNLDRAFDVFYNSKIKLTPFPIAYTTSDELVRSTNAEGRVITTTPAIRPTVNEDITGVRVTIFDTDNPLGSGSAHNNLYDGVALSEMVVTDAEGNRIVITEDMITSNAYRNDQPVANLVDATFDAMGKISDYGQNYHSPWGAADTYVWDPLGYVYFDIELPEGVKSLKFEFHSRVGQWDATFHPAGVYIGNIGEEYDPVAAIPNIYNAQVGEQITAVDQIEDWGVYAIQGLINTNPNTAVIADSLTDDPYWYAGRTPLHKEYVRHSAAYFFTKNSDGSFNIMSIGESKFWAPNGGLTSVLSEAADVKIAASTNADFAGQNTFVLYTELAQPDSVWAAFEYVDTLGTEIFVDSVKVERSYEVLVGWGVGSGLASQTVIDYQPGIDPSNYVGSEEEAQKIVDERYLQAQGGSSAGNKLHFNKISGEGEWKIYRLSLDNPFYYWTTSLVAMAEELGFVVGENPGQYTDLGSYAADLAAAQAVIENNDYAGAQAAAMKLAATLEGLSSGGADRNPITEGVYAIVCDARDNMAHAMQVNAEGDLVGVALANDFESAAGRLQLFHLQAPVNIDELIADGTIAETDKDKVYTILHLNTGKYLVGGNGTSQKVAMGDDIDQAVPFIFKVNPVVDYFTIGRLKDYEGYSQIHLAAAKNVVNWDGESTASSASGWRLIKVDHDPTSVDNLVVEGEAVATEVYTVGGVKAAAPVKGINIVTKTYADGTVKAEKVIVE